MADGMNERVRAMVEAVVRNVVDDEAEVAVAIHASDRTALLEVDVALADVGKIIGRAGATATAIRTILQAISGKTRVKYTMEIIEPGRGGGD